MSQEDVSAGFQYFLSNNKPVLIVTFVGDIDHSTMEIMTKCRNEVKATQGLKFVVLNFRDVDNINGDVISVITQMQLDIRSKQCDLRISSLKPNIKEKLLKMGVIRATELSNNLREALLSLIQASKVQRDAA